MKPAASLQCKSFKIKIEVMPALTKSGAKIDFIRAQRQGIDFIRAGARNGKEGSIAKLIIFPVPKEDIYTWEKIKQLLSLNIKGKYFQVGIYFPSLLVLLLFSHVFIYCVRR